MTYMHYSLSLILVITCSVSGCGGSLDVISDMRELSQDHFSYIDGERRGRLLAGKEWQEKMAVRYGENFFLPWHQGQSRFSRADVEQSWASVADATGKRKKKGGLHRKRMGKLIANAGLGGYPNSSWKGITTGAINLRHLPTALPVQAGRGDEDDKNRPFDRIQVSSVPPGTPVYVSHLSRNRRWALVETGFAFGWTQVGGIAQVSDAFIDRWERGPHAAVIRDKTPFYADGGGFLFRAPLGALFPVASENDETVTIRAPVRSDDGRAEVRRVVLWKGTAAPWPIPLSTGNLAALANELIREPYGWGGMMNRRDCSAMIRDLYAPFGIWLPRHSADQAAEGGLYADLSNLSLEEKRKRIISRGIPYLTLLWLRGHIMIYVGSKNGEPLVFHNFWSVKTRSSEGRPGRKIVGQAAITTLYPGREFNGASSPEGPYLRHLRGMVMVGPTEPVASR